MKAFSIFLILIGVLSFLSIFGVMNLTFGIFIGILFAIIFGIEGVRELIKGNLVGIGGLLFSAFLFARVFIFSASAGQIFLALVASYLVGIGLHMLFRRSTKVNFWSD